MSLIIEAWDHSPLDLEPRDAADDGECGRGLTVVAALSDRWGCERTFGGHAPDVCHRSECAGHHRSVDGFAILPVPGW